MKNTLQIVISVLMALTYARSPAIGIGVLTYLLMDIFWELRTKE